MRLAERAAEHGEVLAEHENEPAVDRAVAGDHAVAQVALRVEAEIRGAVRDEGVELDERAGIEQKLQALTRGQLAAFVLRVDSFLPAAELRLGAHVAQTIEALFLGGHVEIVTSERCPQKR